MPDFKVDNTREELLGALQKASDDVGMALKITQGMARSEVTKDELVGEFRNSIFALLSASERVFDCVNKMAAKSQVKRLEHALAVAKRVAGIDA